jgi:hypothetical protein
MPSLSNEGKKGTRLTPEERDILTRRHAAVIREKSELMSKMIQESTANYKDPPVERSTSNCNTNLQLGLMGIILTIIVVWAQFQRLPPPGPEVGIKFLEKNRYKDGVRQTSSGLQYKIIKKGYGSKPSLTSKVKVDYEGRLLDGQIFDSSFKRGVPMTFEVNKVVKGWTEGLQLMNEGSEYELYLPSELAYGDKYRGNYIYPHAVLIFKVTLIEVKTNAI